MPTRATTDPWRWGLVVALLAGCNYYDFDALGDTDGAAYEGDPFFSAQEWDEVRTHGPLPDRAPPDPTNAWADDPAAAELGQRFYFETSFSGSYTLRFNDNDGSCNGCHEVEGWFGAVSYQIDDWRNVPPVVNSAFYTWFNWDGSRDSMWSQSLGPPEAQMNSSRLRVVHMIFDEYRADYEAIFGALPAALDPEHPDSHRFPAEGGPGLVESELHADNGWPTMTDADRRTANEIYVHFGKALAAYQRRLVSGNAPFDRYVAGDFDALDDSAKRGLRLFIGEARCSECHEGPAFTDNEFYNIGVPQVGSSRGRFDAVELVLADEFNTRSEYSDADVGRLDGLQAADEDVGRYRTKHLRQIAETGRYMHAGQLRNLADVVDFYADGPSVAAGGGVLSETIAPLDLSDGERADLVAFLETLTGDPIPAQLMLDTSR